jgi:hypothetical protein
MVVRLLRTLACPLHGNGARRAIKRRPTSSAGGLKQRGRPNLGLTDAILQKDPRSVGPQTATPCLARRDKVCAWISSRPWSVDGRRGAPAPDPRLVGPNIQAMIAVAQILPRTTTGPVTCSSHQRARIGRWGMYNVWWTRTVVPE